MGTITATEGMWLTQAADLPVEERTFSKLIYLAVNDTADRWKEITHDQYEDYQQQLAELMAEEAELLEEEEE